MVMKSLLLVSIMLFTAEKAYSFRNEPCGPIHPRTNSNNSINNTVSGSTQGDDVPPYQVPVRIAPVAVGQVALVASPNSGARLITNYVHKPFDVQIWNIDPSNIANKEYFIKLQFHKHLVIESPETPGPVFIKTQGDRFINGGIQVWIFEEVENGKWRLRNYKTGLYLYLDYDGRGHGQPGIPINASDQPTGRFDNTYWTITKL